MNELNESFLKKNGNLNPQYIIKYANYNNKKPIIVTWNGNTKEDGYRHASIQHDMLQYLQ